ncbi:hypothetical protein BC830DRAFT_530311 [Chytriomyces sp. MP71]|nr:hypothetical protein BC830DRAFT_530311 [Chytriomyces sp. MP71]
MSTETTALLTKAPLVTIHDSASVEDLAKLMVAEKADAVVVVDAESETLFGLVSDYDICFRVVAAGLDSKSTYLKDIATLDLVAIDERTMAYEALEIMIKRKFRHLLLASSIADGESDNDSGIVGVADIAEILFSKLSSLERLINEPSGVGCPDVAAILKKTKALPSILKISTVKDAAVFMKDRQEGGVLIIEGKTLLGLLTTKDIIHKVVSLGLDPEVTSVADVMTRNPCVGSPETTVLKSIHLMIDGNFTYLPILDKSRPIGLISVVSLVDTLLDYVALIRETLRKDRLKRQNDAVTDSYALSGATDGFKPTSKVKTHVPVTIDQITVQTIMEMPVFGPGYVCTSNLQPNEKDTGKPLAGMKASASNHDLKEPFLPKLAGAGSKAHLRQATWSHSQVSMSATSLLSKGNKMIRRKMVRMLQSRIPKP